MSTKKNRFGGILTGYINLVGAGKCAAFQIAVLVEARIIANNRRMGTTRTRPPDYMREVGRRLRLIRLALGKSAADMCRELETTDRAWSQWENGKRLFDILVAIRLKRRYGVALDWIYDGDPASLPPKLEEWVPREER